MKIDIFDIKEFIELNNLKEITSPILFQRGSIPEPDGLISNEIFGINVRSRKTTFAYIKLNGHFFHPHIYKAYKRLYRNIDRIINGDFYYSIDKDGHIYEDNENGETGLESIYKNWGKLKWDRSDKEGGMKNERIDILTKTKKNEVFMEYQIVIPAFYRDVIADSSGGETDPLNNMYSKLIRLSSVLSDGDMFDFTLHATYYNMQTIIVEIYDYFKTKLANKNGMIRKFLMGKNIDYCVRSVISTPNFHAERPSDMLIDFRHIGIPISQVCSLCYPFMMKWLKDFFENEFITNKYVKFIRKDDVPVEIKNPESTFTDEYIKKMMDQYIRNTESRFKPIEVETTDGRKMKVAFTGKIFDKNHPEDESTISNRPLTVTDILYMAAVDVTKDKHALITRYPVTDSYGVFLGKVRVLSTLRTKPVKINGTVYEFYPDVTPGLNGHETTSRFIETIQFSHSYLSGVNGDYDGDQITCKIIWTQEANAEISEMINKSSYFITPTGKNIRDVGNEAVQTFYALTKDPRESEKPKVVSPSDKEILFTTKSEDYSFSFLIDLLGKRTEGRKILPPKYSSSDTLILEPNEYHNNKTRIRTTIGRYIFNRLIIELPGFVNIFGYVNDIVTSGKLKDLEKVISTKLVEDVITPDQMVKYIDIRDWLGLQFHAVIGTSFTPATIKIPKEVDKLKSELLKKYEKEIADGDQKVTEMIEKQLIDKSMEILKGDIGLDLYDSGARGSIGNNYKNTVLMKGAVLNPITKKYDIITSSLNDGMRKEEIPPNSNAVVTGSYPKAVRCVWQPLNHVNCWNTRNFGQSAAKI